MFPCTGSSRGLTHPQPVWRIAEDSDDRCRVGAAHRLRQPGEFPFGPCRYPNARNRHAARLGLQSRTHRPPEPDRDLAVVTHRRSARTGHCVRRHTRSNWRRQPRQRLYRDGPHAGYDRHAVHAGPLSAHRNPLRNRPGLRRSTHRSRKQSERRHPHRAKRWRKIGPVLA
jgi:hypothetical protein